MQTILTSPGRFTVRSRALTPQAHSPVGFPAASTVLCFFAGLQTWQAAHQSHMLVARTPWDAAWDAGPGMRISFEGSGVQADLPGNSVACFSCLAGAASSNQPVSASTSPCRMIAAASRAVFLWHIRRVIELISPRKVTAASLTVPCASGSASAIALPRPASG